MFLLLVLLCPLILILRVDLFEGTVQGILLLFESPELARKINRRKAIASTTEDQYHSQNTEQQNRCFERIVDQYHSENDVDCRHNKKSQPAAVIQSFQVNGILQFAASATQNQYSQNKGNQGDDDLYLVQDYCSQHDSENTEYKLIVIIVLSGIPEQIADNRYQSCHDQYDTDQIPQCLLHGLRDHQCHDS